jgi:hypothetical protein
MRNVLKHVGHRVNERASARFPYQPMNSMILFGNIMLNMTQVQQSEIDVFGRVVCCRANEPGE